MGAMCSSNSDENTSNRNTSNDNNTSNNHETNSEQDQKEKTNSEKDNDLRSVLLLCILTLVEKLVGYIYWKQRCKNILRKHEDQYKEKYEQLKGVVYACNKKISSRTCTGKRGACTLEYALALRQISSRASITEQQLSNHMELCFCLLPQSIHDNDNILIVPCQNTIATMTNTLNLNQIDDVIQNGNKYSFGILTDAATIPSKIAKKMIRCFIYSKYNYNGTHNEDYKLAKRIENGETTAKAIGDRCKKVPSKDRCGTDMIVVFRTYFGDTASTEQLFNEKYNYRVRFFICCLM